MSKRVVLTIGLAAGLGLVAAFLLTQGLALAQVARADGLAFAQNQDRPATGLEASGSITWALAADTPFTFRRFDAEYSQSTGKVYILGGRLPDNSTDGSIWEFDPLTGVYTDTGVDMPTPVSNYIIAPLVDSNSNEVFVTFGGRPAAGGVVTTVQGYYPISNTTVTFALDPYPVATSPGGVVVVNNIAYSFGGFDAVVVIDDTYFFDITAAAGSRWTTGPNLSLARSYIGAAVVDGVIYALGGDDFVAATLMAVTRTEKLDTSNPVAWDDAGVAEMPVACDENQAFGFDTASPYSFAGQIVVAGCGQWPDEIADSFLYDVGSNTWDASFPDLNQARRNFAGAFIPVGPGGNGTPGMWVWNGIQGADATPVFSVEYFDVEAVPTAGFTSNSPVPLGTPMVFTDTSQGINLSYLWDFGDSLTSTLASPTHTYGTAGTFTVTLTVSNGAGSDSDSQQVEVIQTNFPIYLPIVRRP
ncbi:MAG: PKD domain-containing protein [Chloroflexi bacterium]|nr:PKD domain-containing protein [Chloroflexota bacterium]MCI0646602.1 PKD domain-containing protein [Chloroflexota bacterium]